MQWLPKAQISADLLPYYHVQDEFHLEQGCLVCDCQLMAPVGLRKQILGLAQLGHPCIMCMRRIVRKIYWCLPADRKLVGDCVLGNPSVLISDNGPQFVSSEFQNFLQHHSTTI